MKIQIITLFPEMFTEVLGSSMMWKAQKQGAVEFEVINLREFGIGKRLSVDDTPYGGGDGMLFRPEPVYKAVHFAKRTNKKAVVILPTPRGKLYKQSEAKALAASGSGMIIICPHYEGYDERIALLADKQFCIGNYVLTGGEIPAMVVVDSVVRLMPGVLGGENSKDIESFQDDDQTVEFPQYTRPKVFKKLIVPDVLLNGNHGEIAKWREENKKH